MAIVPHASNTPQHDLGNSVEIYIYIYTYIYIYIYIYIFQYCHLTGSRLLQGAFRLSCILLLLLPTPFSNSTPQRAQRSHVQDYGYKSLAAVKELKLSYHNPETTLFAIYPYYGNCIPQAIYYVLFTIYPSCDNLN